MSVGVHFDIRLWRRNSILLWKSTELDDATLLGALIGKIELIEICGWRDAPKVTRACVTLPQEVKSWFMKFSPGILRRTR